MSMMGFSRLLANIPAAWAAEKYGRRPLLLCGNVLTAAGLAFNGLAHSVPGLVTARFATGVGGSFTLTSSGLYLADISNVKNRARTMAPGATAFIAGKHNIMLIFERDVSSAIFSMQVWESDPVLADIS